MNMSQPLWQMLFGQGQGQRQSGSGIPPGPMPAAMHTPGITPGPMPTAMTNPTPPLHTPGQNTPPGQMPAPANPDVMAATLTAAGAKPPVTGPMAKPPTAVPDRNGAMLPMTSGEIGGYYNDSPDPSQPLTAAGVQTPTQKALTSAGQRLASGLQDVIAPQTEAPRPPAPVSPPGPTVRPDMSALMQTVLNSARTREPNPRQSALAAMLMRGFQ